MTKETEHKLITFLLSIIPISIIIGQAVSLFNIVIISIIIITKIILTKNYNFINKQSILFLAILYIYLLLNTFISIDSGFSFLRNFGFIRFILLFIAINYFFFNFEHKDIFLKVWSLVIIIVLIDSFIEYRFGQNILGYGEDIYSDRIVSFFKDEPVVAGFLNGFFFLILGYFSSFKKIKNNNLFLICMASSLLFLTCVMLTGERSNTIKAIIGLSIFFSLNNKFSLKYRLITFLSLIIVTTTVISNSNYLKYRYLENIVNPILNVEKRDKFLKENIYIKHYKSGYEVFKNYPILGVGNKNYRIETRLNHSKKVNYIADTHPHQIYFELLSEHGLVGTIIILSIIFFLIFKNLRSCLVSRNSLQLGAFSYLIINFLPILPSGSFFSDLNMTLFFINFSVYFASGPSNIFIKKINS